MIEVHCISNLLSLLAPLTLVIALPLLPLIVLGRWKLPPAFPQDIPINGSSNKKYAKIRASYRGWPSALSNLSEGYKKPLREQHNLHEQPFIHAIPSLLPQVILPVKVFEWMTHLPDSMVSAQEAMNESAGLAHLLTGRDSTLEKMATVAVNQHLTAGLDRIQQDLVHELQHSLDRALGTDVDNWQNINIFPVMEEAVTRITTRILFGLPFARNDDYIHAVIRCIHCFGAGMLVCAQLMPWFLQPVFSTLFRIPLSFALWRLSLYTKPLITKWLTEIEQEEKDLDTKARKVPYNLATSFIRIVQGRCDGRLANAHVLTSCLGQFAILPFGTIIPSSCGMLVDLAHQRDLPLSLQQEAAVVLQQREAWNDLRSFRKLPLLESAIKESLRLNPLLLHASNREVIHKDGLTLPTGQHLPRGTWVAASTLDVHHDERFYPNALQYDPCRFLPDGQKPGEIESQSIVRIAPVSGFLAFGAGKHAW